MKQEIERLMAERDLDAIVIEGPDGLGSANAAWRYSINGARLAGTIVQRRGAKPQLIFGSMERQQAEQSGLELVPRERWDIRAIRQRFPKPLDADAEWYRQVFADLGVRGRVAFYGTVHANRLLALVAALNEVAPEVQIVGEYDPDIISVARETKDADELARMAEVGRRTCAVVGEVVEFIKQQRSADDVVVDAAGQPVTIGAIHTFIRQSLDRYGLTAGGTIFAQRRDAGIPHATGQLDAPLRLGQAIVFDIFPRDLETGYFHDMTRTFAIGYAPPELQQVYDDVKATFDEVIAALAVGTPTHDLQKLACRLLRERGHQTPEDAWPIEEGYVHGLGHGIGLDVHEPLAMSTFLDRGDELKPGVVFTIEPGLYYPSRGLGVRIEDTVCCDVDGTFRSLTPFPHDLVIPLSDR